MKLPLLMIFSALCTLPAAAQDSRWITFKTLRDNWGKVEHQIDRTTIRQEGPYRIFWTRLWLTASKQPLAISSGEQLYFVSAEIRGGLHATPVRQPVHRQHRSQRKKRGTPTCGPFAGTGWTKSGHSSGCLQHGQMKAIALLLALTVPRHGAVARSTDDRARQQHAGGLLSAQPVHQTAKGKEGQYRPHVQRQRSALGADESTSDGRRVQPARPSASIPASDLYVDNARLDTRHILDVVNAAVARCTGADRPSTPAIGGNMPRRLLSGSPCIQPVAPESPDAARDRQAALKRGSVRSLQNDPRAGSLQSPRAERSTHRRLAFNVCIKTYVDNGQRDIQQIQSIVHAAVADANAPLLTDPKGDFMTERRR